MVFYCYRFEYQWNVVKIFSIKGKILKDIKSKMSPIFKCLICRKDIERSTKTFWKKKGHLLCSTCLDNIEKNQLIKL